MRNPKRAALVAAPLSLALLLAACSDDDSADPTPTTTTTEATSSSSEGETTAPPASETTAPPATEPASEAGSPLPTDPQDWAAELVRAWGAGDRDRAGELATPEVVDQLFGHADPGGGDWEPIRCEGAAGTTYCSFASASRGEGLTTQQPTVDGLTPIGTAAIAPTANEDGSFAYAASILVQAWGRGDREQAAQYASPTAIQQLFGHADPGGPRWDERDCLVLDGVPTCIFYDPEADERLLVNGRTDGTSQPPVVTVEFRDGASG
jgi:hypothetical protein